MPRSALSLAVEAKLWIGIGFISAAAGFYYFSVIRAMWWNVSTDNKAIALPCISKVCIALLTIAVLVLGFWPQPILALLK